MQPCKPGLVRVPPRRDASGWLCAKRVRDRSRLAALLPSPYWVTVVELLRQLCSKWLVLRQRENVLQVGSAWCAPEDALRGAVCFLLRMCVYNLADMLYQIPS